MRDTDRPGLPVETCQHPRTQHLHGTYAAYVLDRCRCEECRTSRRRYENRRIGRGTNLTGASLARLHVIHLTENGMGLKRIHKVTGIGGGTLSKLIYGVTQDGKQIRPPTRRIHPEMEARILAIELDLADGAPVDRAEADEIIEELVARGWSLTAIAQALGKVGPGLQLDNPSVLAGTLRRLRQLQWEKVPARFDGYGNRRLLPKYAWAPVWPSTAGVPEDPDHVALYRQWWVRSGIDGLNTALAAAKERDADRRRLVPA